MKEGIKLERLLIDIEQRKMDLLHTLQNKYIFIESDFNLEIANDPRMIYIYNQIEELNKDKGCPFDLKNCNWRHN